MKTTPASWGKIWILRAGVGGSPGKGKLLAFLAPRAQRRKLLTCIDCTSISRKFLERYNNTTSRLLLYCWVIRVPKLYDNDSVKASEASRSFLTQQYNTVCHHTSPIFYSDTCSVHCACTRCFLLSVLWERCKFRGVGYLSRENKRYDTRQQLVTLESIYCMIAFVVPLWSETGEHFCFAVAENISRRPILSRS